MRTRQKRSTVTNKQTTHDLIKKTKQHKHINTHTQQQQTKKTAGKQKQQTNTPNIKKQN